MTTETDGPRTVPVAGSTGSIGHLVVEESTRAGRRSSYNRSTEGPDWKRRSERLVRASGHPPQRRGDLPPPDR